MGETLLNLVGGFILSALAALCIYFAIEHDLGIAAFVAALAALMAVVNFVAAAFRELP